LPPIDEKKLENQCHHNGTIFLINITKNASTSIRTSLSLKFADFRKIKEPFHEGKYIRIATARDPMTRAVSSLFEMMKLRSDGPREITKNSKFYKLMGKKEHKEAFISFLREIRNNFYDGHVFPQTRFFDAKNLDYRKDIDFFFRVEHLGDDWKKFADVCKKNGVSIGKIKNLRTTPPKQKQKFKEIISMDDVREELKKTYPEDFEYFDFVNKLKEK
jgi:hypothetical protein